MKELDYSEVGARSIWQETEEVDVSSPDQLSHFQKDIVRGEAVLADKNIQKVIVSIMFLSDNIMLLSY